MRAMWGKKRVNDFEGMPVGLSFVLIIFSGNRVALFSRRFDNGFHLREALLELAADHFIAVHEQTHGFHHKIAFAGHAPLDDG